MGQRTAGDVADLLERSSSDQVTLVAQALVALAEHLDESAPTWRPIGGATEPLKPGECRSHKPGLPRGDDLEEVWHSSQRYRDKFYVDIARSLIEELDRYRNVLDRYRNVPR